MLLAMKYRPYMCPRINRFVLHWMMTVDWRNLEPCIIADESIFGAPPLPLQLCP
jgi:hypothetical protein